MDYTSLANKATNLITKFGCDLTIKRNSLGTFNASLGSYSSLSTLTCTIKGVIRAPLRYKFGDRFADGTEIVAGDREVILSSSATLTPIVGDLLTIGSDDYNVVTVLPVEPGGVQLIYKALVRK
jgi:hypothetical protein